MKCKLVIISRVLLKKKYIGPIKNKFNSFILVSGEQPHRHRGDGRWHMRVGLQGWGKGVGRGFTLNSLHEGPHGRGPKLSWGLCKYSE